MKVDSHCGEYLSRWLNTVLSSLKGGMPKVSIPQFLDGDQRHQPELLRAPEYRTP